MNARFKGLRRNRSTQPRAPSGDRRWVWPGRQRTGRAVTSVSLFDQGLVQVAQASVTGLQPKSPYVLALATRPDGASPLEPLSSFMTNRPARPSSTSSARFASSSRATPPTSAAIWSSCRARRRR